ncbi:LITAF domain-containing protein [Tachyglossus aculeatus]|uniref:LITAF domain-containing protein n=1 Tax=Tachyglossus aculeatus TaxID=9261 RepID=UPI0018F3C5FA|nr:LITAF domain-containing protein [Tachyglossus aculeatus]
MNKQQPPALVTSDGQMQGPSAPPGVYPPPPPYQANPGQPAPAFNPAQTVVMVDPAPAVIVGQVFSDVPARVTCPSCHQSVVTRIVHHVGLMAWLISGGLCLVGCWLGCCLIPFCVDSCQDVDHFCPNCQHLIYRYKRM